MKRKVSTTSKSLLVMLGFVLAFSSCKKDETDAELTMDKTSVEIYAGETATVIIQTGNGGYTVSSSSEATATASVSDAAITITGVAKGLSTVTVTDQGGKTATISVTVNSATIDATTARFKWDNTIFLNTTNGWGTTILSNRVAITNLTDKKQFVLLWTGGYTMGEKTEAKLRIVANGQETTEVALTDLEIQKAENGLYSLIFSNATKSGELVFNK